MRSNYTEGGIISRAFERWGLIVFLVLVLIGGILKLRDRGRSYPFEDDGTEDARREAREPLRGR